MSMNETLKEYYELKDEVNKKKNKLEKLRQMIILEFGTGKHTEFGFKFKISHKTKRYYDSEKVETFLLEQEAEIELYQKITEYDQIDYIKPENKEEDKPKPKSKLKKKKNKPKTKIKALEDYLNE